MFAPAALLAALALTADDPRVTVQSYDVKLVVQPKGRTIRGTANMVVEALEDGVDEIVVSLNAGLRLEVAKDRDGSIPGFGGDVEMETTKLSRFAEGQGYALRVRPPAKKGETRRLVFEYEGEGADPGPSGRDWMGILLVRPDEIRMSHQSQWYPIVPRDPKARAKLAAPMRLELEIPGEMESLGPGRLLKTTKRGGVAVHTWESKRPVRASILAGAYEAREIKSGKNSLRILAFPEHVDGATKWGEEAGLALKVFSKRFGRLKTGQYGIAGMRVRDRSRSYNYEADGFSVFDSVLFDGRDPDRKKIAHEAAHLWWGGQVDPMGPSERFLTESLAEASAMIYLEEQYGEEAAAEAARALSKAFLSGKGKELPVAETTFSSPRYYDVVYRKGAMALRTLRAWVGPDEFDKALKSWAKKYGAPRSTPDLDAFLALFSRKVKDDVATWSAEWLHRTDLPRYRVDFKMGGEAGGQILVSGTLHQEAPVFHNPVELELRLRGGATQRIVLEPDGLETPIEGMASAFVEEIVIDPRAVILSRSR